jgi:hypothetical protein
MTTHESASTAESGAAFDLYGTGIPEVTTPASLLRLRISTDGDPSVLPRLFGYFQNLNITPRRVHAEFGIGEGMFLAIDVFGLAEERLNLIAAKIGQTPCVLSAYWHHL